jgi:hypothetical protein
LLDSFYWFHWLDLLAYPNPLNELNQSNQLNSCQLTETFYRVKAEKTSPALNLTGLLQPIDDFLKLHGIVGKNPLHSPIQFTKQAIF